MSSLVHMYRVKKSKIRSTEPKDSPDLAKRREIETGKKDKHKKKKNSKEEVKKKEKPKDEKRKRQTNTGGKRSKNHITQCTLGNRAQIEPLECLNIDLLFVSYNSTVTTIYDHKTSWKMGNSNCLDIECNSRTFIRSQVPKETIGRARPIKRAKDNLFVL